MKSKKASEPGSEVIESKILVVATSSFSLRFTLTSRACLPVCLPACARFLQRGGGEGSRRYCFAKIEIILSWFEHRTPRHVYLLFFLFFRILPNSTNFFCIKSKTLSVGRVRWQAPRMRRGGIHPEKKRPRRTESRKYVARNGES